MALPPLERYYDMRDCVRAGYQAWELARHFTGSVEGRPLLSIVATDNGLVVFDYDSYLVIKSPHYLEIESKAAGIDLILSGWEMRTLKELFSWLEGEDQTTLLFIWLDGVGFKRKLFMKQPNNFLSVLSSLLKVGKFYHWMINI